MGTERSYVVIPSSDARVASIKLSSAPESISIRRDLDWSPHIKLT
jgi:hypothetical protein